MHPPPRTSLVLVRHGATEWSVSGRHTGRTDLPLLEEGRDQARAVAPLLAGWTFSTVLVSPMQRARETCALAGLGEAAEVTDELCEWDYGDYEGLTTAQIREDVPGWTVWSHAIPNGETIEQVAARADRVIERALAVDGDVVLFAHGHILRVLAARWCELVPQEGKRLVLGTGTRSVLGWEHEYRTIREWNST
jgi:probable phosphoglycerate mutase